VGDSSGSGRRAGGRDREQVRDLDIHFLSPRRLEGEVAGDGKNLFLLFFGECLYYATHFGMPGISI
jgi:hypothetical protein